MQPAGPTLVRRRSHLEGLFADGGAWRAAVEDGDPVVYEVASSPVPEVDRELPQSITTIYPGATGGELWMTRDDYAWVLRHGMGRRVYRAGDPFELVPFGASR